jgi:acetylglutamate synthase
MYSQSSDINTPRFSEKNHNPLNYTEQSYMNALSIIQQKRQKNERRKSLTLLKANPIRITSAQSNKQLSQSHSQNKLIRQSENTNGGTSSLKIDLRRFKR